MERRAEIDGLRAIALLPAILFHAEFPGFGGGYAGADVFFVISGYLISGIILSDVDAGRFSLARFYERRVRRLVPALVLVVACTYPFAWWLLLPDLFRDYSVSMASIAVFGSNILFWRQNGYFTPESIDKPLLATWSLAVEEQYYILFPLLVLGVLRYRPRWLPAVVAVLALASLVLSETLAQVSPNAAYFLAPSRAWEILAGALCTFILRRRALAPDDRLAALGLALILAAFVLFDATTTYPGVHALVPVAGTVLVILFASGTARAARLLSVRPLVLLGLSSYSAYLWHQPVLVFARNLAGDHLGRTELLGLLGLTLAMGLLSWRLVEEPFRRGQASILPDRRHLFAAAAACGLVFGAVGMAGHVLDGMPGRFPGAAEFLRSMSNQPPTLAFMRREGLFEAYREECSFRGFIGDVRDRTAIDPACHTRDPAYAHAVLVWGDSHAQMLHPGLRATLPADWQLLQVATPACPPTLDQAAKTFASCHRSNRLAIETAMTARPDTVLISSRTWPDPAGMVALAERVADLSGARVVIAGPAPLWIPDLPTNLVYNWFDKPRRLEGGLDRRFIELDVVLAEAVARRDPDRIDYFSIRDALCTAEGCLTYLGDDPATTITTFDQFHLVPAASVIVARAGLADAITGRRD